MATFSQVLTRMTTRRSFGRLNKISEMPAIRILSTLRLSSLPSSEEPSMVFPSRIIQRRNMVMVTKTKISDLPEEVVDDDEGTDNQNNFHQISDELMVTPSCLNRVQTLINQRREKNNDTDPTTNHFLRVYVDAGGCSGFQYQFELDNDIDEEEDVVVVVESDESAARIVVDKISLDFLKGSKLDYVQEMIKSSFVVIDNPQSESACGCGSSFAVKNFEANPAID